jgi:hypothetical protein
VGSVVSATYWVNCVEPDRVEEEVEPDRVEEEVEPDRVEEEVEPDRVEEEVKRLAQSHEHGARLQDSRQRRDCLQGA